ncbi:MAG: DALR anticodon-binding domain-containing protein, partial [Bartonella sp.]|nr:DALR anticodon-binding domain-containing protein [Bartonella sp.]
IFFINSNDGDSLLIAIKRAINILENETKKGTTILNKIKPELFIETEEKQLYQATLETEKKMADHIHITELSSALNSLALLKKPINAFFEKVFVNDDNINIRANRLALLDRIRIVTQNVGDFSKLQSKI